ncbi:MAG TPA: type II secretion system F family protein, partial [Pirellulaceae bacterium]|nr:type II secretion system F family protein [Pirellulaceae bacterium]
MADLLTNPWVVQIAVFGGIAALAWIAVEWLARSNSRAEQRLEEFRDPMARKKREEGAGPKKDAAVSRMLKAAAPTLAKPLQAKTEKEQSKLKLKLGYAGFRGEAAPQIFLMMKVIMLCIGLFVGGGVTFLMYGLTQGALIRLVLIAGGSFYFPDLIVMWLGKKRKEAIFLGLPDALDLMVV